MKPAFGTALGLFLALTFGFVAPLARSQQMNLSPSERYPFAKGTIERLDLGSQRLTIKMSTGLRSFDVTSRTYIFRGKERITLDKLKIGEAIRLSYHTNELGQALVTRVKVDPPHSATTSDAVPTTSK